MKHLVKNLFIRVLFKILGTARAGFLRNVWVLAFEYGQLQTMKKWACLNKKGDPIPWFTFPAIEYLDSFDLSGLNILEYGSGNSSLYFLRSGATVTSIEDNENWFKKITTSKPNHHYFLVKDEQPYVQRSEISKSDIVVIDGIHRDECARYILTKIKSGEANPYCIVFDNSDWYGESIELLDSGLGWPRVDFYGFGPINPYTWVTSFYLNPKRIIRRKPGRMSSISGSDVRWH